MKSSNSSDPVGQKSPMHIGKDKTKNIAKTGYGPIIAILFTVFVYFFSQIFAAVLIIFGAEAAQKDAEAVLDSIESSTAMQFVYSVIYSALAIYLIWFFLRIKKLTLKDIGLAKRPKLSDIPLTIGVGFVYFIVLIMAISAVSVLVPGIDVDQEQQLGFENVSPTLFELSMVFASLVILPPLVEEIMIRGYLYTGLRAKLTKITAAIVASILFGIAHLQLGLGAPPLWVAAIDTAILSMFLFYLREKTGSLWAGIFLHALKNGLAFTALFIVK